MLLIIALSITANDRSSAIAGLPCTLASTGGIITVKKRTRTRPKDPRSLTRPPICHRDRATQRVLVFPSTTQFTLLLDVMLLYYSGSIY